MELAKPRFLHLHVYFTLLYVIIFILGLGLNLFEGDIAGYSPQVSSRYTLITCRATKCYKHTNTMLLFFKRRNSVHFIWKR